MCNQQRPSVPYGNRNGYSNEDTNGDSNGDSDRYTNSCVASISTVHPLLSGRSDPQPGNLLVRA